MYFCIKNIFHIYYSMVLLYFCNYGWSYVLLYNILYQFLLKLYLVANFTEYFHRFSHCCNEIVFFYCNNLIIQSFIYSVSLSYFKSNFIHVQTGGLVSVCFKFCHLILNLHPSPSFLRSLLFFRIGVLLVFLINFIS